MTGAQFKAYMTEIADDDFVEVRAFDISFTSYIDRRMGVGITKTLSLKETPARGSEAPHN